MRPLMGEAGAVLTIGKVYYDHCHDPPLSFYVRQIASWDSLSLGLCHFKESQCSESQVRKINHEIVD